MEYSPIAIRQSAKTKTDSRRAKSLRVERSAYGFLPMNLKLTVSFSSCQALLLYFYNKKAD